MKLFGIVGHPVKHSLSPAMHRAAMEHLGLDAEYRLFDIAPDNEEDLANFTYETDLNKIGGFSVTMPYKTAMMHYMDYYDPLAKAVGALNTVVNENSQLIGYNTDATGALAALKEKTELKNKKALVLGAGGAARAIAYVLREGGATVYVYNRTVEKAKELCEEFELELIDLKDVAHAQFDLIVNTTPVGGQATPVGMPPNTQESLLHADQISSHAVVMDIITSPLETQLIKEAKKAGATVITGERMLLHQAVSQFELWFPGKEVPIEVMEKALYLELEKKS